MIAYLKGETLKITGKGIILNTGDVGYFVFLPKKTLSEIQEKDSVELFIHSNIREDAFDLYGFTTYQELEFFKELLNINGIGPKVGLEILNMPVDKVKIAIVSGDTDYLSEIPGIGKKTAHRIVLELKGKVNLMDLDSPSKFADKDVNEDIVEALIKFGYHKHQVLKGLKKVPETITETEEIISYFLKNGH